MAIAGGTTSGRRVHGAGLRRRALVAAAGAALLASITAAPPAEAVSGCAKTTEFDCLTPYVAGYEATKDAGSWADTYYHFTDSGSHNCTRFAAAYAETVLEIPDPGHSFGHAYNWGVADSSVTAKNGYTAAQISYARGKTSAVEADWTRTDTPQVGAIAWWASSNSNEARTAIGSFGHVGVVVEVRDGGAIMVASDNFNEAGIGTSDVTLRSPSGYYPTAFLLPPGFEPPTTGGGEDGPSANDRIDDILHPTGRSEDGFNVRFGARGKWESITQHTNDIDGLLVGDFNEDGYDDILHATEIRGVGLRVKYGSENGMGGWEYYTGLAQSADFLHVGDFDGDGFDDDLLWATGLKSASFKVLYSHESTWKTITTETTIRQNLLVGDFDGNGVDDVMHTTGDSASGFWLTTHSQTWAMGGWTRVANSGWLAPSLRVGDFDENGSDDIMLATGRMEDSWLYKLGGSGKWKTLHEGTTTRPADLLVGDFDGDGFEDDVLYMTGREVGQIWLRVGEFRGIGQLNYDSWERPISYTSVTADRLLVGNFGKPDD